MCFIYLYLSSPLSLLFEKHRYLRLASTSDLESLTCEKCQSLCDTASLPLSFVPAGRRTEPKPPWSLHPGLRAFSWASSVPAGLAWLGLSFWCPQLECWRRKWLELDVIYLLVMQQSYRLTYSKLAVAALWVSSACLCRACISTAGETSISEEQRFKWTERLFWDLNFLPQMGQSGTPEGGGGGGAGAARPLFSLSSKHLYREIFDKNEKIYIFWLFRETL